MGALQRADAGIALAAVGTSTVLVLLDDSAGFLEGVFSSALLLGLGVLVRTAVRTSRAATLERARLRQVSAISPADAARAAVAEERIRLAGDIGAVVRESVTRMAHAAAQAEQARPADQLPALRGIQEEGRQATSDLRRLLSLLRQPMEPRPTASTRAASPSYARRDQLIGAATATLAVAERLTYPGLPTELNRSPMSLVLTVLAAASIAGWRRDPGRSAVVCAAAFSVGAVTQQPVTNGLWMIVTLVGLMCASAARVPQTAWSLVGCLWLPAAVLGSLAWHDPDNVEIVTLIMAVGLLTGLLVKWNEHRRTAADREAAQREADLVVAASTAVQEQRRTVARALHDVLSGSVGVMMMQAGAAEVLLRTDPDAGRAAIAIIRQSAASALTELDEMIPLLGDLPSPGTGDHGLDDLHAMVDRLRAGGLGVSVGLTGDLASLTGTAAATTYRIVQEALTNVLRHAGGAEAFVRIEVQDGGVSVEVRDDGPGMCPGAGPGHGLVGLAERARLAGGTFETGPVSPAGGFRVVAWLPLGARVVMP